MDDIMNNKNDEANNLKHIKYNFSHNLEMYMLMRDISRTELCNALNINKSTASRWFTQVSIPNNVTLKRIAEILDIPEGALFAEYTEKEIYNIAEPYLKFAARLQELELSVADLKKLYKVVDIFF